MTVYRYTLFNPKKRIQGVPLPELVPELPMDQLEHSLDTTDTELSDHEPGSSFNNTNFDLTPFFDFQSYHSHQSEQPYVQYRPISHTSPIMYPQLFQQFPMYLTAPPPMMAYRGQQPTAIPFNQAQPHPQQFNPVIYEAKDINNNLNKRKRVSRGPRSNTGCFVCRLRHLKCDESKPGCIRCDTIGINCEYPENKRHRPVYMVREDAKKMKLHEIKRYTQSTI